MNTPFLSIAALMNKNGFLIQQLMIKAKKSILNFFLSQQTGHTFNSEPSGISSSTCNSLVKARFFQRK